MTRRHLPLLSVCLGIVLGPTAPIRAQTLTPVGLTGTCNPDADRCATVYLDGAVRTADKKSETAAATGSIGVNLARGRWELATQINLAAATDTIRKAPGESLLVPGSGGFTNGLIEGRVRLSSSGILVRAYYSLSSYTWELPAAGADSAFPVAMNALGSGAGLVWRLVDGSVGDQTDTHLHVEVNVGVMNRTLRGDVSDRSLASRRAAFVGSEKLAYNGLEWGMTLAYNDLRGSITYYTFPKASGVEGFTHGQAVAGFAISAPIVQGPIR
jgi:hypothetical protein